MSFDRRAYHRIYNKRVYWERREAGVCPKCRSPNRTKFKLCLDCRQYSTAVATEYRRRNGVNDYDKTTKSK